MTASAAVAPPEQVDGTGTGAGGWAVSYASAAARRGTSVPGPVLGALPADRLETLVGTHVGVGLYMLLDRRLAGPGVLAVDAARAVRVLLPALVAGTADDPALGVVPGADPVAPPPGLALAGCVLRRNGEVSATGAPGALLGSPYAALAWLANTAPEPLQPGRPVLLGSVTALVAVTPGDRLALQIAGLGTVTGTIGAGS